MMRTSSPGPRRWRLAGRRLAVLRELVEERLAGREDEREEADPDERVLDRGRVGVRVATGAG
jgi:hypothetical protein